MRDLAPQSAIRIANNATIDKHTHTHTHSHKHSHTLAHTNTKLTVAPVDALVQGPIKTTQIPPKPTVCVKKATPQDKKVPDQTATTRNARHVVAAVNENRTACADPQVKARTAHRNPVTAVARNVVPKADPVILAMGKNWGGGELTPERKRNRG